jgi:hypothetical protein
VPRIRRELTFILLLAIGGGLAPLDARALGEPAASPDPVEGPAVSRECGFPRSYWLAHPGEWPVSFLVLGRVAYPQDQLLAILNETPRGNGLVRLARELIVTKLDIANGTDPRPIAEAVSASDSVIGNLVVPPIGDDSLPRGSVKDLINALSQYNTVGTTCLSVIVCFPFRDFGDAPSNLVAYSSGTLGRFPTCGPAIGAGGAEVECGVPGPPPGVLGRVVHDGAFASLGCAAIGGRSTIDSESSAKVNDLQAVGTVSACDPAVFVDCTEPAFGRSFGQDECPGSSEAALPSSPRFLAKSRAFLNYSATLCGSTATAYLNILVDWNADGDWNDALAVPAGCAPEWAVRNAAIVLQSGCNHLETPLFQVGPLGGEAWMRLTLTPGPVADDFPWRGSGSAPNGQFSGGETEDYPCVIFDPVAVDPVPWSGRISLGPPQPNPSVGSVRFSLRLDAEERVELAVYSTAGRLVRSLRSGVLPAGEHAVIWDGQDDGGHRTAPGFYVLRLRARGEVQARGFLRTRG